ncbi:MAG TPA: ABC transporter ATP-binding protein [Burkholderiaceae bacterium]|jgi:NitT/TauT family transport system ATP-binding protein|nr:ABC transporter ATP-binding protein [Burkholderiaceae bacterium]
MTAPVPSSGALVVRDLSLHYGEGEQRRTVIERCSFDVPAGQLTVIVGPSGCGKSSLIRLLAGFDAPSRGTITLDGRAVSGPDRRRLVVFQETALFPWMTASSNVLFGPDARGTRAQESHPRAAALLKKVGLQSFGDKYPGQLSGGMQRRAELARALINDPDLMILDEPFRGLDALSRELMQAYYATLFEDTRRTQLFVTSDIDEAVFLADRLLVMSNAPMQVREAIDVDLPRPRQPADVFASDRANDLKMHVLALLHEEAMKSFAGGSRAAADFVQAYARRRAPTGVSPS